MRPRHLLPAACALALLTGGGAVAGSAPATLEVTPAKLELRLVRGQTARTDLTVANPAAQPVTVDVSLSDYTIDSAGAVRFAPAGSLDASAASWSSLSAQSVRIPARSSFLVTLGMKVPKDATVGTRTLAVILQPRGGGQPAVAALVAAGVAHRDGTGLAASGQATVRSVDVEWPSVHDLVTADDHLGAVEDFFLHPTVTAHVVVGNSGNALLGVHGTAAFATSRALPATAGTVTAPHTTVLPSSQRVLDTSWGSAPTAGTGRVRVHLAGTSVTAPASFTIVPWHLLIAMAVPVLTLVALGARRRWRRHRRGDEPTASPWLPDAAS